MREYLNKLPKEFRELVALISRRASLHDLPVYLVGGFVRDILLGVKNLDLDIVVEGDGIAFAEDLCGILKGKLTRHRRFGTATIVLKPALKIDIATARKEFYPKPAHLPVVSRGGLKDDLFRRDFTINAMAIDITKGNFGKLVDIFGGKEDLAGKKLRVLHILSFVDDPTRILRAVRFEKRYDFKIEAATLALLKEAVRSKMLLRVEPQRIRDELILILKEKDPLKEVRRFKALTGFGFISPRLKATGKTFSLLASVRKEIDWFNSNYHYRRPLDAWLVYFIALIDALSFFDAKRICRNFALRSGEEKRMLAYKKINSGFIMRLSRKGIKPSEIYGLLEPLSYETILLLKAGHKNKDLKKHIEDFLEVYNGMRIHSSGHDLYDLGLAPGPHYQKIFSKVLSAKLNGAVRTKEEELELIRKLIKKN